MIQIPLEISRIMHIKSSFLRVSRYPASKIRFTNGKKHLFKIHISLSEVHVTTAIQFVFNTITQIDRNLLLIGCVHACASRWVHSLKLNAMHCKCTVPSLPKVFPVLRIHAVLLACFTHCWDWSKVVHGNRHRVRVLFISKAFAFTELGLSSYLLY